MRPDTRQLPRPSPGDLVRAGHVRAITEQASRAQQRGGGVGPEPAGTIQRRTRQAVVVSGTRPPGTPANPADVRYTVRAYDTGLELADQLPMDGQGARAFKAVASGGGGGEPIQIFPAKPGDPCELVQVAGPGPTFALTWALVMLTEQVAVEMCS